jgi:hypothetical protein
MGDNRGDMAAQTLEFVNRWLYDIEHVLQCRLDSLKDDLCSDDDQISEQASNEAAKILDWLYPSLQPISTGGKLQKISAILNDGTMTEGEREAAIKRAARSTGRGRGRPRNETPKQAIRALSLHHATDLSWREIALEIRGCEHKRPNPERSCEACGEAIRNAAGRLEKFLISMGHKPSFTRGRELDEVSRKTLRKLWRITR